MFAEEPMGEREPKDALITFTLPQRLRNDFARSAAREGLSLAAWTRRACIQAMARQIAVDAGMRPMGNPISNIVSGRV